MRTRKEWLQDDSKIMSDSAAKKVTGEVDVSASLKKPPERIYKPLSKETRDIRLLHQIKGEWSDQICCGLETVSLDDKPRYTAISYVWGDITITDPISLNGHPFLATKNLVAALRQFRALEEPRMVWADALCIDQSSNDEKTHQVALMKDIYKLCEETFVWLGPASQCGNGNQDPFRLLRHFSLDKHWHELPGFSNHKLRSKRRYTETTKSRSMWDGFRQFVDNVWWTRIWTVQEVVLPESVRFFLGAWQIQLSDVILAGKNIVKHSNSCCSGSFFTLPDSDLNMLQRFNKHIHSTSYYREPVDHENRERERDFRELDIIFRGHNNRRCHDKRDRVYGFLGMTGPPSTTDFSPDYSLSQYDAYTSTMRALLQSGKGCIYFLTGTGFGLPSHESGLPSWVRDFSADFDEDSNAADMERFNQQGVYCAAGDIAATISFRRDGLDFPVCGMRVGSVRMVFTRPDRDSDLDAVDDAVQALRSWFHQAREFVQSDKSEVETEVADTAVTKRRTSRRLQFRKFHGQSEPKEHNADSPSPAFWRTVIAECSDEALPEHWEFEWARLSKKALNYLVRNGEEICNPSGPTQTKHHFKYFLPISVATGGRTMFQSDSRRLGLCYPNTTPGDEIWVLFGAKVPFVLRRRPDPPDEGGARVYQFVGECFYDGFMFGEALTDPNLSEEEITLR